MLVPLLLTVAQETRGGGRFVSGSGTKRQRSFFHGSALLLKTKVKQIGVQRLVVFILVKRGRTLKIEEKLEKQKCKDQNTTTQCIARYKKESIP